MRSSLGVVACATVVALRVEDAMSRVTVLSPDGGDVRGIYESSRFRFFGPSDDLSVVGRGIFLDGSALCKPERSVVQDRIVFSDLATVDCDVNEFYAVRVLSPTT